MTTSLKKLLLISITLLLGVMSGGVMAQTDYTYTETFINTGSGSNETFSGVFETTTGSGTQTITGWSSMTFGPSTNPLNNVAATYIPASYSYRPLGAYDALTNTFPPQGNNAYIIFSSAINNPNSNAWAIQIQLDGTTTLGACRRSDCTTDIYASAFSSAGPATITAVGGAPEIDGSLAPKVGFLLGCLFLMFGRKKQNVEPILVSSAI